ncbi:MAG TPA: Xaa-Pro peptidase family protein [Acidimicrobiia bacterium]|nr:Xaa-Pro peptidase family protein [Acidimicrobiia bacterium]
MSAFEYATRVKRLHEQMVDGGVDVTLLSVGADLPYFTGYEAMPSERLTVLVVPASQDPVLFVPELEAPRVEGGDFEMRAWGELDDPVELVSSLVTSPDTVAVGDHMWSIFLTRFQKHWIGASWIPASEITRPLRMRKDRGEIDLLHEAAHAVDRVMARIPAEVRFSGRTESDVARDLAGLTVEEGHERAEFTIVASGPNAASPHHEPGERVIEEGDLVVCDFGGRLDGYFSDSTRTFTVGEPNMLHREVHFVVEAANRAGREAVAPDVPCQEIDRAARRVVTDAGYGPYFIHRTGHGIGLEVHEHPYVVEGNETPLEPGMTFSVEPGIYLPGEFGVRIEDIVVCTEEAGESLNRAERGLIPVG